MTSWPRAVSSFSGTVLLTSHYHLQGNLDVTFGGPGPRGRRGQLRRLDSDFPGSRMCADRN